jgi:hypothetical protein
VPGALAPVKWKIAFDAHHGNLNLMTRFWRAVPPTSDYVALGFVAMSGILGQLPSNPVEEVAGQFRAVHKRALTGASIGVPNDGYIFRNYSNPKQMIFMVEARYSFADLEIPPKSDMFVLDPKMVNKEWSGW